MEDDVLKNLKLSDLSEPPLIESGYEFIMLLPRKQAPNGWHVVLKEHGLNSHMHVTERGLMLSFTTPNYIEFDNVRMRLLRMPWAGEILQWWMRQYTNIRLTRHIDDAAAALVSQVPDISSPVAVSRGVQHAPEVVDAHRNARRAATAAKELAEREQRQLYGEARVALAVKDRADYDEAVKNGETRTFSEWVRTRPDLPPFEEWQQAIAAGEEPRLLLPATTGVSPIDDEDRIARELDAAEIARSKAEEEENFRNPYRAKLGPLVMFIEPQQAATREHDKEGASAREQAVDAAYKEVRDFLVNYAESDRAYSLLEVVANTDLAVEFVEEAIGRLVSEGMVRADGERYRTIQAEAE
jgi:hypothetical protein